MSKQDISGTYRLTRYGYFHSADQRFEPISEFYAGEIQYTSSGHMSVNLRFAQNPTEVSEIVAYSGTYRVEGKQIQHKVTSSVRPEYEGQNLNRVFRLTEDVLELTFEDTPEFKKMAFWKRI